MQESWPSWGRNSVARANILLRSAKSMLWVDISSWREEPIRIWPVLRGCTLNEIESPVVAWAFFHIASLDKLMAHEIGIAVGNHQMALL